MRTTLVIFGLMLTASVGGLLRGQNTPPNSVPDEAVILDSHGIRPDAISRNQGTFVLFILNRLANKTETYTVVSPGQNGGAPAAVAKSATTDANHDCATIPLSLAPGQYQLVLTNHASLSVTITITK